VKKGLKLLQLVKNLLNFSYFIKLVEEALVYHLDTLLIFVRAELILVVLNFSYFLLKLSPIGS